jgi:nucleoside-diphosphate-sugar epimerase
MAPPTLFPLSARRIFVAGHRGMVGSALIHRLTQEECLVLTVGRDAVDLRDQAAVDCWFDEHRPEEGPINIGTGIDVTIAELAQLIADVVGFTERFVLRRLKAGWNPMQAPRRLQARSARLAPAHRSRGRDTSDL